MALYYARYQHVAAQNNRRMLEGFVSIAERRFARAETLLSTHQSKKYTLSEAKQLQAKLLEQHATTKAVVTSSSKLVKIARIHLQEVAGLRMLAETAAACGE